MPRPKKDKSGWDNKRYKNKTEWAKYLREYRAKNAEKLRDYNRKYNQEWRAKNGYYNETNSKLRYPEKQRARRILQTACMTGFIKRGNCEVCHKPKAQAHHDDYSKPLEVRWFCPLHHREHEKKISTVDL